MYIMYITCSESDFHKTTCFNGKVSHMSNLAGFWYNFIYTITGILLICFIYQNVTL